MVFGLAASASPGNLLEMQILRPHYRSTASDTLRIKASLRGYCLENGILNIGVPRKTGESKAVCRFLGPEQLMEIGTQLPELPYHKETKSQKRTAVQSPESGSDLD